MRSDIALVVLLISILALMVVPLPPGLIDGLLVVSISLSVVLLMVAVYLKRPSDFSTFPSVILIATAFRLSLSIATTRLILSEADAGQIIATFGEFVVRGSVVIGLVMFLIITVVQFVVVTKGAERVAEVAARFTLDAMPGKQMSIEADIRAGTLEQEEGTLQRKALDKDSQFFGAMDGAMKFVKGDATAGIIIIFINLIGGMAVGTGVHGLSLGEAASIYSLLTIGDGLVAQIPALLMSICAGVIVTRVANEKPQDLGSDISKELMSDARVPAAAAAVIFLFGFVPGFPFLVFAATSVVLFFMSVWVRSRAKSSEAVDEEGESSESKVTQYANDGPVSDRIGLALSEAAFDALDVDLLVKEVHQRVALHSQRYGVAFPPPFIEKRDLGSGVLSFNIELDEVTVDSGTLVPNVILTDAKKDQLCSLGIDEQHGVAEWILPAKPMFLVESSKSEKLEKSGAKVVSLETALAETLYRRFENSVRVLFSNIQYDEILKTAKELDETTSAFVIEKQPQQNLMRIFRYLLEDGVPLRPTRLLFESLAHWLHLHPEADAVFIAECLRTSMKRQLCDNLANSSSEIGVSMLSPMLEERILNDLKHIKTLEEGAELDNLPLDSTMSDYIVSEARKIQDYDISEDRRVVIVAPSNIRRRLRNFLAQNSMNIAIVSPHEISPDVITFPVAVFGEGYLNPSSPRRTSASRENRMGELFRKKNSELERQSTETQKV